MDLYATVPCPLAAVFHYMTALRRLGEWLPSVVSVEAGDGLVLDVGAAFSVTLRQDGGKVRAMGDIVAYEPPWHIAYRVVAGPQRYILRVTCEVRAGLTRIHIYQGDGGAHLTVALARLEQALVATGDAADSTTRADPDERAIRGPDGAEERAANA